MSTADLDPRTTTTTTSAPLARFLAGEPVRGPRPWGTASDRDVRGPAGPDQDAGAARRPVGRSGGGPGAGAGGGPVAGFGAAGVRGVERRATLRGGLLGAGRAAGDVVVRAAVGADDAEVRRLAVADGGRVPGAPVLIAERAGVAVAAIGVLDRRVVADPTVDAAAAVDRLQAVAAERRGPERRRRWAARLRRGA